MIILLSVLTVIAARNATSNTSYALYGHSGAWILFTGPMPMLGGAISMAHGQSALWGEEDASATAFGWGWVVVNALMWAFGVMWVYIVKTRQLLVAVGYYTVTVGLNYMNVLAFSFY